MSVFWNSRKKYQTSKIPRVAIICNFGYGVSKILEIRIKEKFNVKVVKTLPQNQLNSLKIKEDKIDYLITTTSLLNNSIDIPTLVVSPLLNEKDIKILKEHGFKELKLKDYYEDLMEVINSNCYIRDKVKLKNDISSLFGINNFLNEYNTFFINYMNTSKIKIVEKITNIEEGIEEAGNILEKCNSIDNEYTKSCIKIFKEQGLYMLIGKNSILPHSDNFKNVIKTDYSFLKIREPLQFYLDGNKIEIKNIFLLASKDGKEHRNSLINLKKLIDKYDLEKQLENCNNNEEIMKIFNEVSKKLKEEKL